MPYKAVKISVPGTSEENIDILIALLDSLQYEGISEHGREVVAYIDSESYDRDVLELTLAGVKELLHANILSEETIAERNWNEIWEKNFEPVIINNRCAIRAPFHEKFQDMEYTITIEPKMSFGTGHHETTSLMVTALLEMDLNRKTVLDMGCGSGVLGILALLKNAGRVIAIDNDKWAYENAWENAAKNKVKMEVLLGSTNAIPPLEFDVILANINRNILVEHAPDYCKHLSDTGRILLSGFLEEDIEIIESTYIDLGLTPVNHSSLGKWQLLEMVK
jgi:ribosomal protein L11 methyltransferase